MAGQYASTAFNEIIVSRRIDPSDPFDSSGRPNYIATASTVRSSASVGTDYGYNRASGSGNWISEGVSWNFGGGGHGISEWWDQLYLETGNPELERVDLTVKGTLTGSISNFCCDLGGNVRSRSGYVYTVLVGLDGDKAGLGGFNLFPSSEQLSSSFTSFNTPFSYTWNVPTNTWIDLSARLVVDGMEGGRVDMVNTALVTAVLTDPSVALRSSSGSLVGKGGVFGFSAVAAIPEPSGGAFFAVGSILVCGLARVRASRGKSSSQGLARADSVRSRAA